MEQEVTGDDTSVLQSVLEADAERSALLAEEAALLACEGGAGDRLTAVYARLHEIDAYSAEARAAAILCGLSFDAEAQLRPTKSFSGGWRMRVALARALFIVPDLLLLGEPAAQTHARTHARFLTRLAVYDAQTSRRTTWTCPLSSGWRMCWSTGPTRCSSSRTRATF